MSFDILLGFLFFLLIIIIGSPELACLINRRRALKNGEHWYFDPRGPGFAVIIYQNFFKKEEVREQLKEVSKIKVSRKK